MRPVSRGRVVLVAGASSGIGRAAALALHQRGHRVFGSSRDPARIKDHGVEPVRLEITDDASVRRCVEHVIDRAGRIDALVYSAGSYVAGAAEETSPALAMRQLEAYFLGAHRLARAVLPSMRNQGHGRLVFMSSSATVSAIPFHALYSASKAALERYADGLSYEVAPFGITVTCIQGTSVRTGASAAMHLADPPIAAYEPARTTVIDHFRRSQAQGRPPTAFAAAIVKAVEAHSPPPHYRVGATARLLPWLRVLLPNQLFRTLFGRSFGLSRG